MFGEFESIRIIPRTDTIPALRAFVCYKTPEIASNARIKLHNYIIDDCTLSVAYLELHEVNRKLESEAKEIDIEEIA